MTAVVTSGSSTFTQTSTVTREEDVYERTRTITSGGSTRTTVIASTSTRYLSDPTTTVATHTSTSASSQTRPTAGPHPTHSTDPGQGSGSVPTAAGCPGKNYGGGKFFLRTHVVYGDRKFENLYIGYISETAGNVIPFFTSDRRHAYPAFYDRTTGGLQFYHKNCVTRGLIIDVDDDKNSVSPVFISDAVGTARMNIDWGELVWENDHFGSWLACHNNGEIELQWQDVATNQGIDEKTCAKVHYTALLDTSFESSFTGGLAEGDMAIRHSKSDQSLASETTPLLPQESELNVAKKRGAFPALFAAFTVGLRHDRDWDIR
ncbi:hypothetical protein N0V90_001689 [Kalmusia sp. IMI 367209]|nr:hypothetical protein N0V90_001689 [Kalmusia sp. IMI 367209]